VITTPFTFIATVNAILFTGARPVFVDIEEETFNLDLFLAESAITSRTKAILPVHLYGHMCDMDKVTAMADRYGLSIIEDACQAVGATYIGRSAGSFGCGVFSFYATKNLMCGEGGMITTNDDVIADQCRMIRNHGMKRRYYHELLGYNYRLTDLQAAIGVAQLQRFPEFQRKRSWNADYLNSRIKTMLTPRCKEGYEHGWHQYTVRVRNGQDRDQIVNRLKEAGIETGVYYPIPIHKQSYLEEDYRELTLPVAERMAKEVLSLPIHTHLSLEDLEFIVQEVNKL
jgi:dTDP-4-amino-4,6-dideoxygalactose transaminase